VLLAHAATMDLFRRFFKVIHCICAL
jgi:hypothetical protein